MATPVMRNAVEIRDFTCSNPLGMENFGRP